MRVLSYKEVKELFKEEMHIEIEIDWYINIQYDLLKEYATFFNRFRYNNPLDKGCVLIGVKDTYALVYHFLHTIDFDQRVQVIKELTDDYKYIQIDDLFKYSMGKYNISIVNPYNHTIQRYIGAVIEITKVERATLLLAQQ